LALDQLAVTAIAGASANTSLGNAAKGIFEMNNTISKCDNCNQKMYGKDGRGVRVVALAVCMGLRKPVVNEPSEPNEENICLPATETDLTPGIEVEVDLTKAPPGALNEQCVVCSECAEIGSKSFVAPHTDDACSLCMRKGYTSFDTVFKTCIVKGSLGVASKAMEAVPTQSNVLQQMISDRELEHISDQPLGLRPLIPQPATCPTDLPLIPPTLHVDVHPKINRLREGGRTDAKDGYVRTQTGQAAQSDTTARKITQQLDYILTLTTIANTTRLPLPIAMLCREKNAPVGQFNTSYSSGGVGCSHSGLAGGMKLLAAQQEFESTLAKQLMKARKKALALHEKIETLEMRARVEGQKHKEQQESTQRKIKRMTEAQVDPESRALVASLLTSINDISAEESDGEESVIDGEESDGEESDGEESVTESDTEADNAGTA
jgi:hypothetical protein